MLTMLKLKTMLLLICFIVLYDCTVVPGKECANKDDCVSIKLCPAAVKLLNTRQSNATIRNIFNTAICEMTMKNNRIKSKICCSDFGPITVTDDIIIGNRQGLINVAVNVTNHANIHLIPEKCGKMYSNFIYGGEDANIYEFPWMVLIFRQFEVNGKKQSQAWCGGSIINSKYVLTAAHCINEYVKYARVGEYDVEDKKLDCQGNECHRKISKNIPIEKVITHEHYRKSPPIENDIALLRLQTNIDFTSDNIAPICLPLWKRETSLSGENATVAGWGITEKGTASRVLQKVSIPIISEAKCHDFAESSLVLCAGTKGKDSCRGDSGGPLMLPGAYNNTMRMTIYGLVSYGMARCGSEHPAVYTDVTKFTSWILDNITE